MKRHLYIQAFFLVFLSLILYGCMKDNSPGPDGSDARVKFLGRWSVKETWHKSNYEVTIYADPDSPEGVFIQNFANPGIGVPASASISGNNITLDYEQVIGDGWTIKGGGIYDPETGKIIWNYTIFDGATLFTVTDATYTKL